MNLAAYSLPGCTSQQKRTGQIIGSPEKVAHKQGFITAEQLATLADALKKSGCGLYL